MPLNVIASLSGHSSMNSLRLYLGIDEKEQIEAINLFDFFLSIFIGSVKGITEPSGSFTPTV